MTCVTPIKVNVMLIAASPVRRVTLSLAIALIFAACGPESVRFQPPPSSTPGAPATDAPSMSPSAAPTTDVNAACACWPLTGKPLEAGNASRRPLVVKVDNVPVARPHYGITQADIVVEEIVEGYVTRLEHEWTPLRHGRGCKAKRPERRPHHPQRIDAPGTPDACAACESALASAYTECPVGGGEFRSPHAGMETGIFIRL